MNFFFFTVIFLLTENHFDPFMRQLSFDIAVIIMPCRRMIF